ncbi:nuclear transport factor 2 family protein [Nocardia gipuzkoensis]|uniref:nuclear transport factor 2 family protein n=1 Tax=Nocardia gipuzkoensis TaxID=2749991 RepID=UPI00237E6419|nr:nuclear transport factor 2 family protein [Nocardia gipuzkoensis]MDE1669855.1 nuclear transport factor 2 family protein [Nocardia gipuzkoensis]
MPLDPSAAALLTAVEASPRAVAAHDRSAWVGLFDADGEVNDPVGSRPHVGRAAIERFYDTFIGPNTIAFQVDRDLVHPPTVVRDLTIATTMSTGATVMVPMHLRYRLVEQDGAWKIAHLAAHWELAGMIWQLLRTGLPGLAAALKLGPQLIANQGVGGALGMLQAFGGVGRGGKRATTKLFAAAASTDLSRVRELLGHRADIELPAGTPVSVEEFTNRVRGMRWSKVIAAGHTVTASVRVGGAPGVAIAEFAPGSDGIVALRFYLDSV